MKRLLSLVAASVLALSCGGVQKSVREVREKPVQSLIALDASVVEVQTTFEGKALSGVVRFTKTCGEKTTTTTTRTEVVRDGSKVTENPLPPLTKDEVTARGLPCGTVAELEGLELSLGGVGDVPAARVDREGRFKFDLSKAKPVKGELARIVVQKVPKPILDLLANGVSIGSVDVATFLDSEGVEAIAAAVAARKAADDYPFAGVIHGDLAARNAFTFACEPTGKEVCDNGIDDDCDGDVDWGCSYQTGALQWTLAWPTDDDLDLWVVGPDGELVNGENTSAKQSGLKLDSACGGAGCKHHVENITSPRDKKPMFGTYRAYVRVVSAQKSAEAGRLIQATLGGRLGGHSYRVPLSIPAQGGMRVALAWAVGPDADKDAVIDSEDKCPTQPGPWSPYEADRGCPDKDGDGISDARDVCPDEAGLRKTDEKKLGCPKVYGTAKLSTRGIEFTSSILFATGKADLLPVSSKTLADIADVMKKEPDALRVVAIEGHTDAAGDRETNMKLSRDRVQSVLDWLVKKHGVDAARLTIRWFGPDRPLADNDSDAGRAKNRRVEFHVVEPEPQTFGAW